MMKRFLSLLLCGVLLCGLVTGCGGNDKPTEDDSTTTTSTTTASTTTTTTTTTSTTTTTTTVQTPAGPTTPPNLEDQNVDLGSIFIRGGKAYEYVAYVSSVAEEYAESVNKTADQLAGIANVYTLVIPKAAAWAPDGGDYYYTLQKDGIADIYSMMNSKVKTVDAFSKLDAHHDEYLYFGTDHHWTSLGGYYSYLAFMETAGKTPAPMSSYTEKQFPDFYGLLSSDYYTEGYTLAADTVYAWVPQVNDMEYTDIYGDTYEYNVITDVSDWGSGSKYLTFIAGDQPLVEITNDKVTDGSSIVVVKESFGNAFAPWLVNSYNKVYVIDHRHFPDVFDMTLSEFVKAKGVKDVLFCNNITATCSLTGYIADLVG